MSVLARERGFNAACACTCPSPARFTGVGTNSRRHAAPAGNARGREIRRNRIVAFGSTDVRHRLNF